jgi:transposase
MPASGPRPGQVAVQVSLAAIFISLELSRSTWLITSLVPGGRDKMSKHSLRSGDTAGLLNHLTTLRDKAHARTGASFPIMVIQEAGWMAFGSIACWSGRGLRAILSMPPRS